MSRLVARDFSVVLLRKTSSWTDHVTSRHSWLPDHFVLRVVLRSNSFAPTRHFKEKQSRGWQKRRASEKVRDAWVAVLQGQPRPSNALHDLGLEFRVQG